MSDTREDRPEIFLTQTILPEGRSILEQAGRVRENPLGRPLTEDEIIALGGSADAFVSTFAEPHRVFSRRVIEACPRLKVIGWVGVAYDHIDLDAATARGVYVTYLDLQCPAVADHAFALLLCAAKQIIPAYQQTKAGRWGEEGIFFNLRFIGRDVHHKTIGLVGLGRIGLEVARRARGFDMRVLYYDVVRREQAERELGAEAVPFEVLLRESDFVSCHLPLTPQTRRFFGRREFGLMKPTAFFINTSRGGCVDTEALCDALGDRVIAGAALDVIDPEPLPPDHRALALDNLILVPHMAGLTVETRLAQHIEVAKDTVRVLRGFKPRKFLNAQVVDVRPLPDAPD